MPTLNQARTSESSEPLLRIKLKKYNKLSGEEKHQRICTHPGSSSFLIHLCEVFKPQWACVETTAGALLFSEVCAQRCKVNSQVKRLTLDI